MGGPVIGGEMGDISAIGGEMGGGSATGGETRGLAIGGNTNYRKLLPRPRGGDWGLNRGLVVGEEGRHFRNDTSCLVTTAR